MNFVTDERLGFDCYKLRVLDGWPVAHAPPAFISFVRLSVMSRQPGLVPAVDCFFRQFPYIATKENRQVRSAALCSDVMYYLLHFHTSSVAAQSLLPSVLEVLSC